MDTQKQYFKLPIYYNAKKRKLNANIIKDLELVKNADSSAESDVSDNQAKSMYDHYLNVQTPLASSLVDTLSEYYTTDANFLKDNQKVLKRYVRLDDSRNYEKWELMDSVGNKFNRCIIFKGKRSHQSGVYFGTDKQEEKIFWHCARTQTPRLTFSYIIYDKNVWDDMVDDIGYVKS